MTFVVRGKRRRWVAAGAAVLVAVAVVTVVAVQGGDPAPAAAATTAVQRGEVTSSVAASGKVSPVASRELAFSVAGTLTSVLVKPGDEVVAGQDLATIDDADAQEARDDAANALSEAEQALVDARAAATDDTATGCTSARSAAYGTTGQDAVTAGSAVLLTYQATTPPAASTTATATARTSPTPTGSPTPSASASPKPSASPSRTPAPSTGSGCSSGGSSNGSGGATGGRGSGGDAIYSAEVAVNKAGADLARAERDLAGTTITAPVGAKVLSVGGKAGDAVSTSTFITLGVVATMMVEAEFAEADAVSLAVGQPATVTLANRPDETLTATIAQVAATGTATGTLVRYHVLLAFDGTPEGLLIGQSATAGVVLDRAEGLLLPQSAVRVTSDTTGEVKLPDGTPRTIGIGLRGDGDVEVTSGLAEGDTVRLNARS
ncbi:efflux RND transporter periplasmic adaptor subunit [Catellatospora vulcania]|uniref:efflux RND transporter periplasmic adaptor subunit n=1 Tax=Catellatospora vulcania TaxID=1460450 RepID=UPI0012D454CB|nr:biotin/lipoyl-binding protein [Catellatospora vulcania]